MRNLLLLMFLGFAVNAFAAYFPLKDTFFTDGEKTLTLENNTVKPANPVVGDSKLYVKSGLLTLLGSDGIESPIGGLRKWATATTYKADDIIWYATDEKIYRVVSDHTSGTFATDLAGGKLEEISATEALNHNDSLNKQGGESSNYWHSTLNQHERSKDIEYVNYVKGYDSNAEGTLAGGWILYDDGAVTRPVDGTAGSSSTLTFSRNTTTPLLNTGDFSFAKSAANGQGEGVAYAYTVQKAHQSQILEVSFEYDTSSANYSCDYTVTPSVCDVGVYSYDGTSVYHIGDLPAGKGTFRGTFQADSTNTHRLIFHVQSTDATAYTLYFDDIVVKPVGKAVVAPIISEWIAYTPSSYSGFGTPTGVDLKYKRIGDSIMIAGKLTAGSVSAALAEVALPTGMTISTTKVNASGEIRGRAYRNTASGSVFFAVIIEDGRTYLRFSDNLINATFAPLTEANGDAMLGTGETLHIITELIPIEGMAGDSASSILLEQQETISFMTDPPAQNLELGTTGVNFGTATNTAGALVKTDAALDATNLDFGESYWTILEDGYYDMSYQVYATRATSTSAIQTFISINNSTAVSGRWGNFYGVMTSTFTSVTASGSANGVRLSKGDTVRVKVIMLGDGATIAASGGHRNAFYLRKSSNNTRGNQEDAPVFEKWDTSSSLISSSTSSGVAVFTNKVRSTHGAYSASTGKFTAPRDDLYEVCATVRNDTTMTAAFGGLLLTGGDGVSTADYNKVLGSIINSSTVKSNGCQTVTMAKGEQAWVVPYQVNATGTQALNGSAQQNWITWRSLK